MTNEEIKKLRTKYTIKFNSGRFNLILAVIFSVINIVFMLLNVNFFIFFAAELPCILVGFGLVFTAKYPRIYHPVKASVDGSARLLPDSFLYLMITISAFILLYYVLCWVFSKKQHPGWLIAAAAGLFIDTGFSLVLILVGGGIYALINVVFHIWVICFLISGAVACNKLKELPTEEYVVEAEETVGETLPNNEYALGPKDCKLPENGEENK